MKSLFVGALTLVGAIASAQTAEWYAARFGYNAPAPDLFSNQTQNDYKNYIFNEGKPNARFNNSAQVMLGSGVKQATIGRPYNDPGNRPWNDLYEQTDLLPKNTWVRVTGNLANHFPEPFNMKGHANPQRNYYAIITRIMFRGNDLSNGLNLLWNITPGVYPSSTPTDPWKQISVSPWGAALNQAVVTDDPAKRDWWRPQDVYFPYLRNHVQNFVYDVNNVASNIVRQRSPSGPITENFIGRMGFQLGNEPAAGHPGGSVDGQVGSWDGVGKVLEKTTAGLDYRPLPSNMNTNQVPNGFGSNPINMPAFSMFSEGVDSYRLNYVKGQLRNIQWGGPIAPGLNEIATYSKEMNGMQWPTICGRRSLHYMSPILRWKFNATTAYMSNNTNDLLASQPFDPSSGRWETAAEYAKRWVIELEKQVDLVGNLPMPGSSNVVDITECYLTGAQSAGTFLPAGIKTSNGSPLDFKAYTFDQIRELSRSGSNKDGTYTPWQQVPPSRESLLAAIRTELYNRDMAKTLTPKLGRIYWWGGYYSDPRAETGLNSDDNNDVNSYNPFADFRLTLSEVKALWNLP